MEPQTRRTFARVRSKAEHEGARFGEVISVAATPAEGNLSDDLLVGAEAIAKALNWKTTNGRWNRRRVYHLAGKGELPFHKVPGLGVVCRKTALASYFNALDAKCLGSVQGDSQR
jgi:hypothetical protein